jgi:hypothetical protein
LVRLASYVTKTIPVIRMPSSASSRTALPAARRGRAARPGSPPPRGPARCFLDVDDLGYATALRNSAGVLVAVVVLLLLRALDRLPVLRR